MSKTKLALAALALAALAAACTSQAGNQAGAPAASRSSARATRLLSCTQQYQIWKTGVRPMVRRMAAALKRVYDAASAEDIPASLRALRRLGPPVSAVQAVPMPRCADPAGYWSKILARLKAACDDAGSAKGLVGMLVAVEPLKALKPLETKLTAELRRKAGVKTVF